MTWGRESLGLAAMSLSCRAPAATSRYAQMKTAPEGAVLRPEVLGGPDRLRRWCEADAGVWLTPSMCRQPMSCRLRQGLVWFRAFRWWRSCNQRNTFLACRYRPESLLWDHRGC